MNKIKFFIIGLTMILTINQGYSQISYSIKTETGFLMYQNNTIQVDPGPNWKGYNLYEQNGIDFNIVNGIDFENKLFVGIGIGYLNFEGINGFYAFTDFEYLPLKTKLTPLVNLKIGYSHIWNQYENGTGTGLVELSTGLNYRLTEKIDIYAKSGFTITQQSLLIPIRLGIKF
ncbi:MAG: hypothetical protein WBK40_08625 [Bacteroidales bacterium]|jgi:hypothetical protein|nr:hypothetical protein [Bacteroidales bacterium]NLH34305.1 hypothetical protein [Lentimicrobium sp.]MBP7873438.1 hypothetical protein [Bacteroidales bacterium]HNV49691.1 hypothetical protein [Bacteroidales bacterium]HPW42453.1 hypothetical protein [Bacteroidales bacterium]